MHSGLSACCTGANSIVLFAIQLWDPLVASHNSNNRLSPFWYFREWVAGKLGTDVPKKPSFSSG